MGKQPESAKGLIVAARYLTAISWLTYPGVYMIKMVGLAGPIATTYEQVGYSMADRSRRVHDQDGWPRRSHCHHLRAGRLLDGRRRRQGGVWRPHLGHRGGQVFGGGKGPRGLISSRFVFLILGVKTLG